MKLIRELLETKKIAKGPSPQWKAALVAKAHEAIKDAESLKGKKIDSDKIKSVKIYGDYHCLPKDLGTKYLLDLNAYNHGTQEINSVQKELGVVVDFASGATIQMGATIDVTEDGFDFQYFTARATGHGAGDGKYTRKDFAYSSALTAATEAHKYLHGGGKNGYSPLDGFLDALDGFNDGNSDVELIHLVNGIHLVNRASDEKITIKFTDKKSLIRLLLKLHTEGAKTKVEDLISCSRDADHDYPEFKAIEKSLGK